MDKSQLIPFAFNDNLVRIVMRAGAPWFVAKDVCRVLAIKNYRDAMSRLDDDEKGVATADTLGGRQDMNVVSESGLYALIFSSRKEEARGFRKWVTAEVLPAIRQQGGYEAPERAQAALETAELPVTQLNANVALVREARSLFGVAAARQLWEMIGLPCCVAPTHVDGFAEAQGFEALETIFAAKHNDRTIRDLLSAAIGGDEGVKRALSALGFAISEREDGLVVACSSAFLDGLFIAGRHYMALRFIAGARRTRAYFGGVQQRGVLLPLSTVEAILHAREAA